MPEAAIKKYLSTFQEFELFKLNFTFLEGNNDNQILYFRIPLQSWLTEFTGEL